MKGKSRQRNIVFLINNILHVRYKNVAGNVGKKTSMDYKLSYSSTSNEYNMQMKYKWNKKETLQSILSPLHTDFNM